MDVVCELAGESRENVERIQEKIMSLQLEEADLDKEVKDKKKPVTKYKTQATRLQKLLDKLDFQLQATKRKTSAPGPNPHECPLNPLAFLTVLILYHQVSA